MRANTEQVIKNIVRIISNNDKKIEQLEKVQSITMNCTSDDHIRIKCELYKNNIARYLIEGTMSGMTITANTLTNEITRKHRNEKAWYEAEVDCWPKHEHTRLQVCSFIDHLLSLLRTYTQETFHNILPVGTE